MRKFKSTFLKSGQDIFGKLSYLYFLFYEFLSPYIEVLGILVTILMFSVSMINVNFMLMFYLFYALLGVMISVATYTSTVYINQLEFSVGKLLKVLLLCIFEICIFRFILSGVRLMSLIGYNKNKYQWGSNKRKEMKKV